MSAMDMRTKHHIISAIQRGCSLNRITSTSMAASPATTSNTPTYTNRSLLPRSSTYNKALPHYMGINKVHTSPPIHRTRVQILGSMTAGQQVPRNLSSHNTPAASPLQPTRAVPPVLLWPSLHHHHPFPAHPDPPTHTLPTPTIQITPFTPADSQSCSPWIPSRTEPRQTASRYSTRIRTERQ